MVVIRTERLLLRPWREKDAEILQSIANHKSISKFTRVPYPYKLKDAKKFIRDSAKKRRKKEEFCFAIVIKNTNELIGSISLVKINWFYKWAEVGYWIGKDFRGNGFMSEAVRGLLDYGFKKINLNRIEINCFVENKASKRVIEKVGGVFEGKMRQKVFLRGKFYDLLVFSILRKEWRNYGGYDSSLK